MPTNSAAPLRTMRAAAMVIISSAVYAASPPAPVFFSDTTLSDMLCCSLDAPPELGKVGRAADVTINPGRERLTVARNRIPLLVEGVVPRIVAERVRWERAALHLAHGAHRPLRKHHGVHGRVEAVDDFLDRDDRPLRREH